MSADVVVVGAGGHAKVCVEILQSMGERVAFCVADVDSPLRSCVGVEVLLGDACLAELAASGYSRLFVALGENVTRSRLASKAVSLGFELVTAISPTAVVSPSAKIGKGVVIMPTAVVNADARIDDLCIVNTGATIDHDCVLGRGVHVAPQCGLAGGVRVSDWAFLGAGTIVLPNISIGTEAVVGAGAVVVANVPDGALCKGVPGRSTQKIYGDQLL
jgi:UDP-perosamine 4-acetyltransferase